MGSINTCISVRASLRCTVSRHSPTVAALLTVAAFSPGAGRAAPLLQFAKLVSPQEALQLGLVDRVVPAPQLLPAAEAAMKQVCPVVA
jgi:enoyl-CoA hydratase/carnithine racemase